ncbi:response regulator [Ruminococcaceae bacterium OttesenSCG-928-A16]|nr:response regulator [Ruminococcaceae bacterium OttesenSCG-928-A16]
MLTILLVDDESNERTGIRFLIEKYKLPLKVMEAANGKDALEYIRSRPVDILLTDIKMPYMDGLELAKEVFGYNPLIKIIIFSSYGEFEYAKMALEANVVNYLLKPIEVDEFVRVMQGVINECEKQQLQQKQEKERKKADQQQILYQLLTGARFGGASLPKGNNILPGRWFVLFNIETRNSMFLVKENEFLRLVQTHAPVAFNYINTYPNAAYLVFYGNRKLGEDVLENFAQKLRRDIHQVLEEYNSILIGKEFEGVENLAAQAALLNKLRAGIFEGDAGVLFAEKMAENNNYYAENIEECRKIIVEAIAHKDMDETALRIQRLVASLHNEKAISLVYMHHIFYDLVTRLYQAQGIYDNALIQKRIEQVVQSGGLQELSSLFREIMAEVMENSEAMDGAGVAHNVMQIIEREYSKDISLEYIAEKVHLSPSYLSYLYKQETGTNIIKQLADYRMAKAKDLLSDSRMKIADIARLCGYANPSYFNRLFKNMYGITPTKYRENQA